MKLKTSENRVLKPASPEAAPIAEALAEFIARAAPLLTHSIAWGNRCYSGNAWVLSIIPHKAHVNLQFERGAELAARGVALEGTGKSLRHLKLRSVEDAKSDAVKRLILQAVALDQELAHV